MFSFQGFVSVSRQIKQYFKDNKLKFERPADFYSQKNCAIQYNVMISEAEKGAPRKKRGTASGADSPAQVVVQNATEEWMNELAENIAEHEKELEM